MAPLSPNAGRYNLRDYGGYARVGGGRLRRGLLYRSAQFDQALPADAAILARLGIATVIDLRSGVEFGAGLSCAFDGFSGEILAAQSEDGAIPHALGGLMRLNAVADVAGHMIATYRVLPTSGRFTESLALYFGSLAGRDGGNLVHCFAGKDRTGLAVALFHQVLGVHADDMFDDYLRTNTMGDERIASGLATLRGQSDIAVSDAVLREAMGVKPDYLVAALETIAAQFGDPAAYLMQAAGVSRGDLERIADRLTE